MSLLPRNQLRAGITIVDDSPGAGPPVQRHQTYLIRLKMWLNQGDPIRWQSPWGVTDRAKLEDDGETLVMEVQIDREQLVNGLYYGIEGMHVGGTRTLRISPHLAYGARGIPGVIPANALIVAEISVIEERVVSD